MPLVDLVVLAMCFAASVLAIWGVFRGGHDGDESDPGDDGPGPRRPPPAPPPPPRPDPTVSWPEFERQFAEHVATLSHDADRAGSPR